MKRFILYIIVTIIVINISSMQVFADDSLPIILDGGETKVVPSWTYTDVYLSSSMVKAMIVGELSTVLYVLGPIPRISKELAGMISAGFGGFIFSLIGDVKYPAIVVRINYFKKNQISLQYPSGQPYQWINFE